MRALIAVKIFIGLGLTAFAQNRPPAGPRVRGPPRAVRVPTAPEISGPVVLEKDGSSFLASAATAPPASCGSTRTVSGSAASARSA